MFIVLRQYICVNEVLSQSVKGRSEHSVCREQESISVNCKKIKLNSFSAVESSR
jgi:hypothetical protein